MTTSIVTAYTAPNLTRVAVVRFQGADYTVRQSPKKVTTVWLGSVRITKASQPKAWHTIAAAAFAEWEAPAAPALVTETVEHWGPDPVVVTREYDAPATGWKAATVATEGDSPADRCPDCTAPVTDHLPWCKGTTLDREEREAQDTPAPGLSDRIATRLSGWRYVRGHGNVTVVRDRATTEDVGTLRRTSPVHGHWEALDAHGYVRVSGALSRGAAAQALAEWLEKAADRQRAEGERNARLMAHRTAMRAADRPAEDTLPGGYPPFTTEEAQEANDAGLHLFAPQGGSYSHEVRDGLHGAHLGVVRCMTETLGEGHWVRFVAYRPDGSRVGTSRTRVGAARLLLPALSPATVTLTNPELWR